MEDVKICRLCFDMIDDKNFKILEEVQVEMLRIILVNLDISVSNEPVMCNNCARNLKKCFDFKMTCLNTEDCIKTFANRQDPMKVNLEDVFIKDQTKNCINNRIKQKICRLCFNLDADSFMELNNIEDKVLRDMLKKCIPELNLNMTNDPKICNICYDSLKFEFSFIITCLDLEEKIKNYRSVEANASISKVDLHEVLQFVTSIKTEIDSGNRIAHHTVSQETGSCTISENANKSDAPIKGVKIEEAEFQSDNMILGGEQEKNARAVDIDIHNLEIPGTDETVKDRQNKLLDPLVEARLVLLNSVQPESRMYTCKKCSYSTDSNRDLKMHYLTHAGKKRMYECPSCPFITRHRNVIDNHKLTHKSSDEIDWFQCNICTYRSKLKANLSHHQQTHEKSDDLKRFKCEDCPYRTLWRRDLERHILKHKPPGQTVMYKCDFCTFTTKHQRYLKYHVDKLHLGTIIPDDTTYSCAQCSFITKLKRCLVPHMITHRDPTELKIYKCSVCSYQAKWKESVKKHELVHKNLYKCDECEFETNLRRFLTKHKVEHKSVEDMPIYSCDMCNYQTRRRQGLRNHMLVHKNADEVKMHECQHCVYSTKRLADLKQHVLIIHTENITVYSCEHCGYQTKYKYNFKQHNKMMHENPGDFETKRRECLRMHMVTHKSKDELEMFKCSECPYETKYKRALKKHITGHRPDAEKETIVYRCSQCNFETKWTQTIRKHWRKHEEAGEVNEGLPGWEVVPMVGSVKKEPLVM